MKRKLLTFLLTLLACTGAAAQTCWNPFGCPPRNLNDCVIAAAKMPTSEGVRLANANCQRNFRAVTESGCRSDAAALKLPESAKMKAGRQRLPTLAGLDDQDFVDAVHELYYSDISREKVAESLDPRPPAKDRAACQHQFPALYR